MIRIKRFFWSNLPWGQEAAYDLNNEFNTIMSDTANGAQQTFDYFWGTISQANDFFWQATSSLATDIQDLFTP